MVDGSVAAEEVVAEVVSGTANDGVDVVRAVLGVVVLDEQLVGLEPVVVGRAVTRLAREREAERPDVERARHRLA